MFDERTQAEKGFSAIWADKIAPGLALYAPEYERKKRWGILGSIVITALVLWIYIHFTFIQPWESDDAQAILIVASGLTGVLLGFLAFYPHTKLVNAYTAFLKK